jgi:ATP-binding cassette subfamily B protein
LFLGNLFEFLDLEPQIADPPVAVPTPTSISRGISFSGITFCYPDSHEAVLDNFSLELPARQVTAIVGPNGAGKTTLVKLLCRFYEPQAGCIEIDGVDIRNFSLDRLRRLITILFQAPVAYQMTAAQNIAFGDVASHPTLPEIEEAGRAAGAHDFISRLPKGYETLLGKWFAGGAELSGGEWQRVALSRAFLRDAPIVILDEPTSLMDSWAEAAWLAHFRHLVQDQTSLIITHRFTTAMKADIIHVMDGGEIVESGSHSQLLALDGLYAQSWKAQMQAANTLADLAKQDGERADLIGVIA